MKAAGSARRQRGGFFVGLIVGLLLGLGVALAVALYVTKVPVPFINKVPQRSAEQDAAQLEKNRRWDPNAGLTGKPAAATLPASAPAPAPGAGPAPVKTPVAAAKPADKTASAPAAADAFIYFVQVGAYARSEDAEQQRANLALQGLAARITEREQAGRIVYRVRLGPFERKDEADATKERLDAAGQESALVRVQR